MNLHRWTAIRRLLLLGSRPRRSSGSRFQKAMVNVRWRMLATWRLRSVADERQRLWATWRLMPMADERPRLLAIRRLSVGSCLVAERYPLLSSS